MSEHQDKPETHQPTKKELEEVIRIDATPDQLGDAVLKGGTARQGPKKH